MLQHAVEDFLISQLRLQQLELNVSGLEHECNPSTSLRATVSARDCHCQAGYKVLYLLLTCMVTRLPECEPPAALRIALIWSSAAGLPDIWKLCQSDCNSNFKYYNRLWQVLQLVILVFSRQPTDKLRSLDHSRCHRPTIRRTVFRQILADQLDSSGCCTQSRACESEPQAPRNDERDPASEGYALSDNALSVKPDPGTVIRRHCWSEDLGSGGQTTLMPGLSCSVVLLGSCNS